MPNALVDALDPALTRLVAHMLAGGRRALGVGSGTELLQLRPYQSGDEVRHIDAAASARTGRLHVRLHVPERSLTTWIVLDLSPGMAFGTARRLKADVAEGVALVFARLGVRRAGNIGVIAFGAGELRLLPPRGARLGMVALRRLLAEGVAPDGTDAGPDALAQALERVARIARQPGLVVVVSDLRDQQRWERLLGALRLQHATVVVEISDPREHELPAVGRLALVDPRSGELIQLDSSSPRIRERFAAIERERRETIAAQLRSLGVRHVRLHTDEDWLLELGRRIG